MGGMPFNTMDEFLVWLLDAPLRILIIIFGAIILRWLVHRSIGQIEKSAVTRAERRPGRLDRLMKVDPNDLERRRQRALTLGSLLRSLSTFGIGLVAVLMVMSEFGLPLGPLLASAGVGGVALGFGAQSLVKDFLSGVFMIIEDQYGVGDVIDTGEATGTVEEVGLRITRLRDATGVVWFIRNGEILRIGNKSEGWAAALIDIPVSYEEEPAEVIDILEKVVDAVYGDEAWHDKFVERPDVVGVESVSGGVMTVRIVAKCYPGEQWAIPRVMRQRAKAQLDAAGVKGPQINPFGAQTTQ
ncbi:mechanosensitive ion channel family protein [Ornithinimicrobium sp. Arc0846-15]|nr:mechanosensitive ion channel family protein [Ornithinimicrobium laminariae]